MPEEQHSDLVLGKILQIYEGRRAKTISAVYGTQTSIYDVMHVWRNV